MYKLLTVAAVLYLIGVSSATAQSAPPSADPVCHGMGTIASAAAQYRDRAVPLSQVLSDVRSKIATDAPKTGLAGQMMAAMLISIENAIIEVYKSNISANDAYLKYREQCEAGGSAKAYVDE
jgi:hypothetical protein